MKYFQITIEDGTDAKMRLVKTIDHILEHYVERDAQAEFKIHVTETKGGEITPDLLQLLEQLTGHRQNINANTFRVSTFNR